LFIKPPIFVDKITTISSLAGHKILSNRKYYAKKVALFLPLETKKELAHLIRLAKWPKFAIISTRIN